MKGMAGLVMALTLGALALAACGESDEDKARAVVKLVIDSDPARCDSMTTKFINQTSGSVKECRRNATQAAEPYRAKIESLDVDGDEATAIVGLSGARHRFTLVKQDDDWKIDGLRGLAREKGTEATADSSPKPKIRKGLDARATVDAYYQAIEDEDGAALCGLLSRQFAIQLRGGEKTPNPIADCVQGLQVFDWSKARKTAKGVESVEVTQSGSTATVTLSNGKRAVLKRQKNRWVIDAIKVKG